MELDPSQTTLCGLFPLQLHISDNFTLIDEQQRGLGIGLEFANQRVIDLRSQQVIQHIHRGCEQHMTVAAKRDTSLAVEMEPVVRLRSGLR